MDSVPSCAHTGADQVQWLGLSGMAGSPVPQCRPGDYRSDGAGWSVCGQCVVISPATDLHQGLVIVVMVISS